MRTEFATLAGEVANQDSYIIGETFAAVLDGATSVANDRSHDPGDYATRLGRALEEAIDADEGVDTADAVARAIAVVRDDLRLSPKSSPTSTIALVRWHANTLETFVLGDSLVILLRRDGSEAIRADDRLATVADVERSTYRDKLVNGRGYGIAHRAALLALQAAQAKQRNVSGGYWIAGADPLAARHGIRSTHVLSDLVGVLLASDGVALDRLPWALTWADVFEAANKDGPQHVLLGIQSVEEGDPDGRRWPRSKRHDDKTLVVLSDLGPER